MKDVRHRKNYLYMLIHYATGDQTDRIAGRSS
jgi:hypothetical protein